MNRQSNIDDLSDRLFLLYEYKYYTGDISEAPEDEEEMEDEETEDVESGDDIEDEDIEDLEGDEFDDDMGDEEIEGGFEDMESEEDFGEEEVEVDVSEIVDGVDQNSENITNISSKLDSMGTQLGEYISKIMKTNKALANQVDQLEKNISKEFRKRTPTPNEELMMRSMSSYPYNQKLTDYWQPASGGEYDYSIENPNQESMGDIQMKVTDKSSEDTTPKDYVLTDKDVEEDYSELDVRNSL